MSLNILNSKKTAIESTRGLGEEIQNQIPSFELYTVLLLYCTTITSGDLERIIFRLLSLPITELFSK